MRLHGNPGRASGGKGLRQDRSAIGNGNRACCLDRDGAASAFRSGQHFAVNAGRVIAIDEAIDGQRPRLHVNRAGRPARFGRGVDVTALLQTQRAAIFDGNRAAGTAAQDAGLDARSIRQRERFAHDVDASARIHAEVIRMDERGIPHDELAAANRHLASTLHAIDCDGGVVLERNLAESTHRRIAVAGGID